MLLVDKVLVDSCIRWPVRRAAWEHGSHSNEHGSWGWPGGAYHTSSPAYKSMFSQLFPPPHLHSPYPTMHFLRSPTLLLGSAADFGRTQSKKLVQVQGVGNLVLSLNP